ncbi:MAG: FIST signal transduction protein [Rhodoferax sp.]
MKTVQTVARQDAVDQADFHPLQAIHPQLVLAFGSVPAMQAAAPLLERAFPGAHRMGCTTAGEISGDGVNDGSLVVTAVHFDHTRLHQSATVLRDMEDSHAAGVRLAQGLPTQGLRAVVVLGQGVAINGSAVIAGLTDVLGAGMPITGGLAGDGGAFARTHVLDDAGLSHERVVALGLYGERLGFAHGSFGGWSPFGPARKVTRSHSNVLYELDGEPALTVYKKYLGEHAKGLPASGLLFPFAMLGSDHNEIGLIRTILGVDEAQGSLTLAGEIDPQGYLKLMHANTDALVDGAEAAAQAARDMRSGDGQGLALLVSCVGRKLVMGGRVDEEVEAVANVFGSGATLTGFYSYGEISPFTKAVDCKLHNQTMTITYIGESCA